MMCCTAVAQICYWRLKHIETYLILLQRVVYQIHVVKKLECILSALEIHCCALVVIRVWYQAALSPLVRT